MTTPSFVEKWRLSTITEEREVSWSQHHPSRTGPSRWRGCNHCSHDNLQQDLADWRMANPVDPVLSQHTSRERQQCQNRTISLITHPSKVMLKIILTEFDRVWHAALWATMEKYSISANLIRVIKNLYDKVTSAVLFNSSIGDWFRTTV